MGAGIVEDDYLVGPKDEYAQFFSVVFDERTGPGAAARDGEETNPMAGAWIRVLICNGRISHAGIVEAGAGVQRIKGSKALRVQGFERSRDQESSGLRG